MHVSPRLNRRLPALATLCVALVGATLVPASQTSAARRALPVPTVSHQLPFTCAQAWTGGTRSRHSPSRHAVDFNRANDLGKGVVASAAGRVSLAVPAGRSGYGRHVVIDHGNGESTVYAHLKNVLVAAGSAVDQGTLIGAVGNTGNTSGAHLHYEQKVGRDVVPVHFAGVSFGGGAVSSGNCVDVPMAANLSGDRTAELVVFRRARKGEFWVHHRDGSAPTVQRFGGGTDEPLLGDWDGNGLAEPGVWNARGRQFKLSGPAGMTRFRFGARGDRPVTGDWDGDGRTDVGVFRPSSATFWLRSGSGAVTTVVLGDADDVPVTGDWNGDGRTDVGVHDRASSLYTLRHVDAAGLPVTVAVPFGYPGDLPVTGDWEGDGTTDLGSWTPSTAVFNLSQATGASADARTVATVQFGKPR